MKRRNFLGLASTGTLASLASVKDLSAQTATSAQPVTPSGPPVPVLLNPTDTTIEVLLAIDSPGTGWVEFGTSQSLGNRVDAASHGLRPFSAQSLRFKLTGLIPGQRYHYRAFFQPIQFARQARPAGEVWSSDVNTFTTLNPAGDKTTFTVWNDTHENATTVTALSEQLLAHPTDFLFWNGDVTNDLHQPDTAHRQYLRSPASAAASHTPFFFGRGNHDVRGRYARELTDLIKGPDGPYRFGFRHGPVAFLVLDTGEDKPDTHPAYGGLVDFASYREEQRHWLEKTIQQPWFTQAPFRVALLHIPLVWDAEVPAQWPGVWGSGIRGWICEDGYAKWSALLDRAKVDIVISGHTHSPAHFPPNHQHRYTQLIGGGPKPEQATIIAAQATADRLEITTRELVSGKKIFALAFKPQI